MGGFFEKPILYEEERGGGVTSFYICIIIVIFTHYMGNRGVLNIPIDDIM
jgi:hypothetical protein